MIRLLALGWLLQAAAGSPGGSSYDAGMDCFERLDFACARDLLNDAVRSLAPDDVERRVRARRALAETYLALGQREAAVAQFESLLRERPEYASEPGVSPKILDALDEARARLGRIDPGPRPARPEAQARLELTAGVGAEFLAGDDRGTLADGPALGLGLALRLGAFRLGGEMRYTQHAAQANSRTLHLGSGCLLAGRVWEWDRWEAGMGVGLGVARFGVPAEEGRWALWLPLRARASWRWFGRFWTGVAVTPGWMVVLDGPGSSFTVSLEGVLGLGF